MAGVVEHHHTPHRTPVARLAILFRRLHFYSMGAQGAPKWVALGSVVVAPVGGHPLEVSSTIPNGDDNVM